MSGHSKWSTIRHKKAAVDARRGKLFTKLIRELTSAAKAGGGDPEANPRLRTAIANAKAANMPADTIQRAIKKGTGELPGEVYEEVTYEGYGAGGVAVLVDALTDNRNRTVAEIRHLFSKYGGNLGENGCVAWMFDRKGLLTVDAQEIDEDELLELVLEAGGDDVKVADEVYEIYTTPRFRPRFSRAVRTPARQPLSERLRRIYAGLSETVQTWQPDAVSVERVFIADNPKTALILGHARGVALLTVAHAAVPLVEYSALEIKLAVVGYGRAAKSQIQQMVKTLLGLEVLPQPADAADALAAAICHLHTHRFPGRGKA